MGGPLWHQPTAGAGHDALHAPMPAKHMGGASLQGLGLDPVMQRGACVGLGGAPAPVAAMPFL